MNRSRLGRLADRILDFVSLDIDFAEIDERWSDITPTIVLGSRPKSADVEAMRNAGITRVVSCVEADQRSDLTFLADEVDHRFIELSDTMAQDLSPAFQQLTALDVGQAGERVLVHCEVGVSRSASMVIAHLMSTEQLSFIDAFERVRAKRVRVLPNLGFASQLQRLERELRPDLADAPISSLARYLCGFCAVPGEVDDIEQALRRSDYDAVAALEQMFGGGIPRVVQGVRRA